jgi:hypothetical protein
MQQNFERRRSPRLPLLLEWMTYTSAFSEASLSATSTIFAKMYESRWQRCETEHELSALKEASESLMLSPRHKRVQILMITWHKKNRAHNTIINCHCNKGSWDVCWNLEDPEPGLNVTSAELLYRNVLIFVAYRDAPEKILLTEFTPYRQTKFGLKLLLV